MALGTLHGPSIQQAQQEQSEEADWRTGPSPRILLWFGYGLNVPQWSCAGSSVPKAEAGGGGTSQEEVPSSLGYSLVRHHKGFQVTPWWLPPESAYKGGSQPLPLSPVLY